MSETSNSLPNYTEAQLIAAIQKGSHQALDMLYDKYAPVFLGVIRRIVYDEKIADEVLTESFVDIWTKISDYDILKGHFFIWMMNIVRSNALETNKIKPQYEKEVPASSEERIVISDILSESPQVFEPKALKLVLFRGYCYEEVAEELGVHSDSIKGRVRLEFKQLGLK